MSQSIRKEMRVTYKCIAFLKFLYKLPNMLMEWITIIIHVNDVLFPLPEVLRDDIAYSIIH
jgi:hypothetical protein